MEKSNIVARDGLTRLPPGFRFQPTDEELVFQYLKCKVFSWPLPASIIPEINVCKYDPWDLPGDVEQEKYFFSNKEAKYRNGNRTNRATACGYWKATGLDKHIVSSASNQMMGIRKTLVFHRGRPPHGCRTDWIMHEYRLVAPSAGTDANVPCPYLQTTQLHKIAQLDNWVLCRIFLKKRSSSTDDQQTQPGRDVDNNFMSIDNTDLSPASSSSSSSSSVIPDAAADN